LLEVDGVELSNHDTIVNAFSSFFRGRMGMTILFFNIGVNWEQLYSTREQPSLIYLEEPFTIKEIHDDILLAFLADAQTIFFFDIFQALFDGNLDLFRFDTVYIVLVPKMIGARRICDFRLISLINGIFKIIFNVLACRLKKKILLNLL